MIHLGPLSPWGMSVLHVHHSNRLEVLLAVLNRLLAEAGFDPWVEKLCAPHYADDRGRPGIPPGTYFRMLLVGYFEGIGSQRGIAWRCSDSLSLRDFLGIPLGDDSPDHSSLSVIRNRLPLAVHGEVTDPEVDVRLAPAR